MAHLDLDRLLDGLRYLYPATIFVYFAATSAYAACTLQTASEAAKIKHRQPKLIISLLLLFISLQFGQLLERVVHGFTGPEWPPETTVVGLLSCILVFGIEQVSLGSATDVVWYPFYGSWFIAVVFEPIVAVLSVLAWIQRLSSKTVGPKVFLWIDLVIIITRYLTLLAVLVAYFLGREKSEEGTDEETSPLIPKSDQRAGSDAGTVDSGYGTGNTSGNDTQGSNTEASTPTDPESPWERRQRLAKEQMEKRLKSEGSWIAYAKGFLIFVPYIWPVHDRRLQLYTALVGVCLLAGNALNVLIPRQMGILLDSFSGASTANPWVQVLIFAALRLAASEAGIHLIRQLLWMPVDLYAEESLSVAAYNHVMNLSADFHDSKSSSDLLVAISQGKALSRLLESVCFEALPMLIDLVVAFVYLSVTFGPYEGFITIATGVAFVQAATYLIARLDAQRKNMVKMYFEEQYVRQAGIQGWHTVSAFNQIPYEERRHQTAVTSEISAMKGLYAGYLIGHGFQYLILLSGLIAGAFLAVYQVTHGKRTAGDFVMLLTYWGQLTSPLRFFSNLGKTMSQDLVYAERLLGVMMTEPTITERPDAKPLLLKGGDITLHNVRFSYDKKKDILKGVSLTVPWGKTAAFVGSTGAGKSTILKLLDRFYDVTEGSIKIDEQDIRDIQLSSLRQSIGIVPQAPILFDDTIMANIRYARLSATDEEVHEACRAAAIHDHIMTFSDDYQTRVGERGVKISGGELQRIAIARAILKRPEIVLLDEATSSVDTETEHKIQEGLRILCDARTTFIVAHRLSTVMNADIIFVVSDGDVVEHGSHEELLERGGKYSELWSKQIFVKPKETKDPDGSVTNDSADQEPETEAGASSTEGSSKIPVAKETKPSNGSPTTETKPAAHSSKLVRSVQAPKLITTALPANTNGKSKKTPNGHKKEGSRLNPGAPEFTPRSPVCIPSPRSELVVSPRTSGSPTRTSWADDVEDNTGKAVAATHSVSVQAAEPNTPGACAGNENTKPTEENSPQDVVKAGYRHREPNDTTRSVSDPVPQQPVPCAPTTPKKNDPAEAKSPLGENANQNATRPGQPQVSANRTLSRSRGRGSRGRGGRHHGGRGRGARRTVSNPQRTTTA